MECESDGEGRALFACERGGGGDGARVCEFEMKAASGFKSSMK